LSASSDKTSYQCVRATDPFRKQNQSSATGCSYCENATNPDFKFDRKSDDFIPVLEDRSITSLLCLTCVVYKQLFPFIAAGQTLTCDAYSGKELFESIWYVSKIIPWMVGASLIVCFGILMFLVAFTILDIFLRLGFVIITTPLLITAWAFPISRKYAIKGWEFFIHCMLQFLGLSISIALLMSVFTAMLPDEAASTLINAMAGSDSKILYEAFVGNESGGSFYVMFVLILTFIFGWTLITTSGKIMEALSGIAIAIPGLSLALLTSTVGFAIGMTKLPLSITEDEEGKNILTRTKDKSKDYIKDTTKEGIGKIRQGGAKFADKVSGTTKNAAEFLEMKAFTAGMDMDDKAAESFKKGKFVKGMMQTAAGGMAVLAGSSASIATRVTGATLGGVAKYGVSVLGAPIRAMDAVRNTYNTVVPSPLLSANAKKRKRSTQNRLDGKRIY
jgi:hypothetical protein